jgi:glycosyltransferase involved in cell wall biosynthesis
MLCIRLGIKNAKHVLFLGQNTKSDAQKFSSMNFVDPTNKKYKANTVIYNGINNIYLTTQSADEAKAKLTGLEFDAAKKTQLATLKAKHKIVKPYFFFISVWRKYKNIERLAEGFAEFNVKHDNRYQLVLGGGQDQKYPEIIKNIKLLEQYQLGNIIITGKVVDDKDVILLYDGAEALVAPSLSEGFGLWMVEAAARGVPVIASDIPIFHEVGGDSICYFDPLNTSDLARQLSKFVVTGMETKNQKSRKLFEFTKQFRWSKIAVDIMEVIKNYAK